MKIMNTFYKITLILKNLDSILKYHIQYLNRPDLVAQLAEHWDSIPKIVGFILAVVKHIFQFARCEYKLSVIQFCYDVFT